MGTQITEESLAITRLALDQPSHCYRVLSIAISVDVYCYCGSYVESLALGSVGTLLKKICHGLALPGLIVSTTLFIHISMELFPFPFALEHKQTP